MLYMEDALVIEPYTHSYVFVLFTVGKFEEILRNNSSKLNADESGMRMIFSEVGTMAQRNEKLQFGPNSVVLLAQMANMFAHGLTGDASDAWSRLLYSGWLGKESEKEFITFYLKMTDALFRQMREHYAYRPELLQELQAACSWTP